MKIIYLANVRLPTEKAHGYQIVRTAAEFACQGADVELVVPRRRNRNLKSIDPFSYYGAPKVKKIILKRLFCIDLIGVPLFKRMGPFAFWLQTATFAVFARVLLRRAKVDWVYCRDELLMDIIGPIRQRLVLELHALPSARYRHLLDRADRIVVITQAIKHGLVGQEIAAEKIVVAPDAVDLQQFSILPSRDGARITLDWSIKHKIAVYTGYPYAWKGIFTLIESSRYLSDEWVVVMVGGLRNDLDYVKSEIVKRGLSSIDGYNRLQVIDHKHRQFIPLYFAAADVLVLPNSANNERSRLYTSPLKLFEYMMSGRPIVASDLPSIREVVSEREVIFVKPDDPQDLARGIREAVGQPQEERVAAAKELVKKYTWEARAKTILDTLTCIDKSGRL